MTEEEIKLKETELLNKENELAEREAQLAEREAQDNTAQLVTDLKTGYEQKLLKQHDDFKKRLDERDNMIKQLLTGDQPADEKNIIEIKIEALNAKRDAQNKKY